MESNDRPPKITAADVQAALAGGNRRYILCVINAPTIVADIAKMANVARQAFGIRSDRDVAEWVNTQLAAIADYAAGIQPGDVAITDKSMVDWRGIAVEAVDYARGFTIEHAGDSDFHSALYDSMEHALKRRFGGDT